MLSMIFHTKLPGVNVNVGKLVLGLGQLSMKNHTQHDLWHLYSTHLSDPTLQLCVSPDFFLHLGIRFKNQLDCVTFGL